MNHLTTAALLLHLALAGAISASEPAPMTLKSTVPAVKAKPGISLTVYSSADPAGFDAQQFIAQQRQGGNPGAAWQVPGFGVVKEVRAVPIEKGFHVLRFTDVAAFIDPTTVSFVDLTDPATAVVEQNFEFDLVSPEKLLERYTDRVISIDRVIGDREERVTGTLLSARNGQLLLQTIEGLQMIPQQNARVIFSDLPGGLITRPTLVWKLNGESAGEHLVRTTYQTAGLTWKSDYNLVLSDDERSADLAAWVTLLNLSGAAYQNANLKLVAGDVQRIVPQLLMRGMAAPRSAMAEAAGSEGFEEKSFFEYHLYTLPRATDVLANATQQITLFPTARGVPIDKVLLFEGTSAYAGWGYAGEPYVDRGMGAVSNPKIDVILRLRNDEASRLGRPLPKGKVRVYKQDDADGTLEFVGEDLIDHTARNEKVSIKVGQSFDVVGERTQTDFTIDTGRRVMTESFKVELRNRKTVPQKVLVREHLFRWAGWEITAKNTEFVKKDARTIEFEVDVPADGVRTVEYTVRYIW